MKYMHAKENFSKPELDSWQNSEFMNFGYQTDVDNYRLNSTTGSVMIDVQCLLSFIICNNVSFLGGNDYFEQKLFTL